MKSINVILYWIIVMVIGLSACGDDDTGSDRRGENMDCR